VVAIAALACYLVKEGHDNANDDDVGFVTFDQICSVGRDSASRSRIACRFYDKPMLLLHWGRRSEPSLVSTSR
jgi:hypothetical protein